MDGWMDGWMDEWRNICRWACIYTHNTFVSTGVFACIHMISRTDTGIQSHKCSGAYLSTFLSHICRYLFL